MATFSRTLIRAVVGGDVSGVRRLLDREPRLATMASSAGATRTRQTDYFIKEIAHYLYEGDTALHLAAAAYRKDIAALLVSAGADCRAKNRRGAQPLHYACDTNHWDPAGQVETIKYLISIGADPNAQNQDGATPLHRAVRTRSSAAVQALLAGGANPALANKNGSTARALARLTTGRSGSGSALAKEQQAAIERLLNR